MPPNPDKRGFALLKTAFSGFSNELTDQPALHGRHCMAGRLTSLLIGRGAKPLRINILGVRLYMYITCMPTNGSACPNPDL